MMLDAFAVRDLLLSASLRSAGVEHTPPVVGDAAERMRISRRDYQRRCRAELTPEERRADWVRYQRERRERLVAQGLTVNGTARKKRT